MAENPTDTSFVDGPAAALLELAEGLFAQSGDLANRARNAIVLGETTVLSVGIAPARRCSVRIGDRGGPGGLWLFEPTVRVRCWRALSR